MTATREEKIEAFEKLLRQAPDIMTPPMVVKFVPFGKNKVRELLQTKQLKAYKYKNTQIITKIDLIEYLVDHSDDPRTSNLGGGQ